MEKPILYNGYKIGELLDIKNRIDKLFFTEVYKLSNDKFLYLFLDIKENDILNSDIEIKKIKINNKMFIGVVVDEFNIKYLNNLKDSLVSVRGFKSIAGMQDLKNKLLEEIILPFKNKDKFLKYKVTLPNGLLFYGPPGCGKTYISNKLAEELGWNFMEIKHSSIASPHIHGTVGKIGQVFEKAKLKAPIVLFFDEISGLVPKRENLTGDSQYKEEEINEFLINLDNASKEGILVLGATNYPNKIDSAILRTGRFDLKLYIGPPDEDTRIKLFSFYLNGRPVNENINYQKLSELTENYIVSDIEFIVESVAKKAALKDEIISQEMIEETIKSIEKSLSDSELEYFNSIYFAEKDSNNRKIGFMID
ncbi:MAG: ATP-binding protein [Candidatus Gracilibacteria bacterium]|nr:ATP-binding protein [Candidatus Gracilibacteria bacterium]MDD4530334.1 ATP-binding protein [Candidatus Gracilibacteria bacterium]